MNEDALIQKIRSWCSATHLPSTMIGVGDDAAAIFSSGRPVLFCSDLTIEKTHFDLKFSKPEDVGHKCLARVLSDLAAMAAEPRGATVSIALPLAWSAAAIDSFLEKFYQGAVRIARETKTALLGGDLSRLDGPLVIDVAAIGETRVRSTAWRRSGARPGDVAFVTGTLGGAAIALREFQRHGHTSALSTALAARHLRPTPRLDVAERFASHPVNAAIDISDGLAIDSARLCRASGVSLEIEHGAIPVFTESMTGLTSADRLDLALNGGDDYELLLAIPANWVDTEFAQSELKAIGATRIGTFQPKV